MAKIKSGILGAYSGTIGNVTGYRRLGENIIQGMPIKKNAALNSSLHTNEVLMKNFHTQLNKFERQILRMLTYLGVENRFEKNLIWKNSKSYNNFSSQYYSGAFYFPCTSYLPNLNVQASYDFTTQSVSISLRPTRKFYGYTQYNKYRRSGIVGLNGLPFSSIITDNTNTASAGGSLLTQPVGRYDMYSIAMIDSSNQTIGDVLLYSAARY